VHRIANIKREILNLCLQTMVYMLSIYENETAYIGRDYIHKTLSVDVDRYTI
jgi:hypothetical protein